MKTAIKVTRKTRQHFVLFCAGTPFKPKRVEIKTRYQRKDKHTTKGIFND